MVKEVHYFDGSYERGQRFYRSKFPISLPSRLHVESSPYMLFHPLAPGRASRDLPSSTQFVVLLREPADRALSHYQLERRKGREPETFARALELEEDRLAGTADEVSQGGRSSPHRRFSYRARGNYAEQLERWFDVLERDRIHVVESEQLFQSPATADHLLTTLGLSPFGVPFPALNATAEPGPEDAAARERLRLDFAEQNERLFRLLGRRLWSSADAETGPSEGS